MGFFKTLKKGAKGAVKGVQKYNAWKEKQAKSELSKARMETKRYRALTAREKAKRNYEKTMSSSGGGGLGFGFGAPPPVKKKKGSGSIWDMM